MMSYNDDEVDSDGGVDDDDAISFMVLDIAIVFAMVFRKAAYQKAHTSPAELHEKKDETTSGCACVFVCAHVCTSPPVLFLGHRLHQVYVHNF